MSREYPAFIIDRSRRSEASRFSDDFVVCPDKEVGFIARVYKLPKSRRGEFKKSMEGLTESEIDNRYIFAVVGEAFCVLEVVRMLYEPVAHINRLRPLMKKALKAYLHGEEYAMSPSSKNNKTWIKRFEEAGLDMEPVARKAK